MNSLRSQIRKMLSEAHYTTWKSIDDVESLQFEEGVNSLHDIQSDIVQKLSKHLDIKKIAMLGHGTQGYAYYIPNNRVLKITTDKSEAAEAFKVKGKKLKHLANVYEVFTLSGRYEGNYVIISELLNKSETIDEADNLLSSYLDKEFGYSISFFFEDYSNGSMSRDEIKEYSTGLKDFYGKNSEEARLAIWFMTEKFGVIDDIRRSGIKSTDWGLTNLGLKKDGHIAMYDMGYGDPNVPDAVQNIHLNQEAKLAPNEYPDFFDTQNNPILHNTPFPPVVNVNDKPLSETEISSEEINKKDLPYKFPQLFDDFIREKTEPEIREIAPEIDLSQEPGLLMMTMETNYPSLFDNFADWLFNREEKQTTIGSGNV